MPSTALLFEVLLLMRFPDGPPPTTRSQGHEALCGSCERDVRPYTAMPLSDVPIVVLPETRLSRTTPPSTSTSSMPLLPSRRSFSMTEFRSVGRASKHRQALKRIPSAVQPRTLFWVIKL